MENNEDNSGILQDPLPILHFSDHAPVHPLTYFIRHQNHLKGLVRNVHSLVSSPLQILIWSESGISKKHAFFF